MSGYGALALFYDRLVGPEEQNARAARYISLFERYGTLPPLLLDLACGSLGLSLPLLRRGTDVIGVDGSQDMLALAARRAADAGYSPLLLCQDMRRLDLYGTVGGALCGMDGLNHLGRTAEIAGVLGRLRHFIEPGGLFLFDVNTPYKHREVLGERVFVLEEEDFLCVWRNALNDRTCEVRMLLDFFIRRPDAAGELYDRIGDEVRERAYSRRTLERLLTAAGFDTLAVLDGDRDALPRQDSERWLFVTRRMK